jgi:hypothetical protein
MIKSLPKANIKATWQHNHAEIDAHNKTRTLNGDDATRNLPRRS